MKDPTILISAKSNALTGWLKSALLLERYRLVESRSGSETLKLLKRVGADLVVLGVSASDGRDVLLLARQIREQDQKIPLILITAESSEELAIAALKCGINDYFKQPFTFDELKAALDRYLSFGVSEQTPLNNETCAELLDGERLIGESAVLKDIRAYIVKVAPTDTTVLVTGETGTGKELVAQLIHKNSARHQKPFVCVNCAAIPENLLESELFGYERGAFTGAYFSREGRLKMADAGTVFFDEIGDMDLHAQAKILRTLESREVYRLGGKTSLPVNVRFIAATNQDLEQLSDEGKFRKDLFFRLNVARIVLPPLRKRKEDIPQLFGHYIERFNRLFGQQVSGFEEETLQFLLHHDWPGNVRELKNLLEAIFVNRPSGKISLADLPEKFRSSWENLQQKPPNEQERLLSALFSTNWNKSKAAQRLHWSRMTIYRKIAKYHLSKTGASASERSDRPPI